MGVGVDFFFFLFRCRVRTDGAREFFPFISGCVWGGIHFSFTIKQAVLWHFFFRKRGAIRIFQKFVRIRFFSIGWILFKRIYSKLLYKYIKFINELNLKMDHKKSKVSQNFKKKFNLVWTQNTITSITPSTPVVQHVCDQRNSLSLNNINNAIVNLFHFFFFFFITENDGFLYIF